MRVTLGNPNCSWSRWQAAPNQVNRLFGCTVSLIYEDENRRTAVNSLIADRTELWWTPARARSGGTMGEQDSPERAVFQRDHPPPGAARCRWT